MVARACGKRVGPVRAASGARWPGNDRRSLIVRLVTQNRARTRDPRRPGFFELRFVTVRVVAFEPSRVVVDALGYEVFAGFLEDRATLLTV